MVNKNKCADCRHSMVVAWGTKVNAEGKREHFDLYGRRLTRCVKEDGEQE